MRSSFALRMSTLLALLVFVLAACGTPSTGGTTGNASTAASPSASASTESSASSAASPSASTASASASTASTSPSGSAAAPAGSSAAGSGAAVAGSGDQGACTPEAASTEAVTNPILEIGTGNTGGVFFPYGGGIARVLTDKLAGANVTAQETGGSVDNMKLIANDEADLGMSTVDSAYDAITGQGAYVDTGAIPACAIATLYTSFVHVVASEASGITSVESMAGKTVSVGSAGSSTEGAADRILEAAGLDPKAGISRQNLSVNDSVAAMKDGKIDGFFWIGGLPTSAVTDLVTTGTVPITFVPTAQYVPALVEKYGPAYTPFALPGGTYQGFDQDVPGTGIANILFVNASMNEQLAYDITKTMFDNLADVQASHPAAGDLSLETAVQGSSIPFHPGALRFYREKGIVK